jgi:peptidoglycan-N-acetylglucosamine deacetylase
MLVGLRVERDRLRVDLDAERSAAASQVTQLAGDLDETEARLEALQQEIAALEALAPPTTPVPQADTISPAPGQVALTFDDGPYPEYTPAILDILDRYNVKATFFAVGVEIARHPEIVREIARRGHVVANHTWHHRDLTTMSDAEVEAELTSASDAIEALAGKRPTCMRPPMGKIDERVRGIANRLGLGIALWDIDALDLQKPPAPAIYDRVVPVVAERGAEKSSNVLLHDGGGDRTSTVEALPVVIEGIQRLGRPIVPLCA